MREISDSPVILSLRRAVRRGGVKTALTIIGCIAAIGIFAPFLANESALVWHDDHGWSFPAFTELFNRNSYPQYYDFIFNLIAIFSPILAIIWFSKRNTWTIARRLGWMSGLVLGIFVICNLPCIPGKGHGGMRAIWADRSPSECTSIELRLHRNNPHVWALLPPIPHRQDATYAGAVLSSPGLRNDATGARFLLGTDSTGHDVLARMIFGSRISLTIGIVATGLSLAIGTIIGAISGYFGGMVDLILQRIVEIMMCFPTFVLVLSIVAMTSRDIFIIMAVIGLTGWASTARLVRGEFLAQSVRDYVAAGEALGLSKRRIMFRHILPNTLTPLLITATFGVAGAVLVESGLAFLGLGDPNAPSWGGLLNQGQENIDYVWLIYVPGIAVFLLVSSLNVLGNALREAFDPKSTS